MINLNIIFSDLIKQKIKNLKLGVLIGIYVESSPDSTNVKLEFENLKSFIIDKFKNNIPSNDPVVSSVRGMYRKIGWDPTKYRPSSEAMIRRIIKNKMIYRINNLVDLGNITSARYHIPMGIYDIKKISGDIL